MISRTPSSRDLPRKGVLAEASPELFDALCDLALPRDLDEGEVLFSQGEAGDALYALESGELEVSVLSAEGRKLSLDVFHPGTVFGEIALFDQGVRTATITARAPSTLMQVQRSDLLGLIRANPGMAVSLFELLGRRLRAISGQLHQHVFLSLQMRLARKVLHLTGGGEHPSVVLMMSQGELADFVGASREAVSKALTAWTREGYIEATRKQIRILDRAALHEMAGFDFI